MNTLTTLQQQFRGIGRRFGLPTLIYSLVICAITISTTAQAASTELSGPSSSTTGNYTISSVSNVCGQSKAHLTLIENNSTVQTGCSISKSFTAKPTGNYSYKLRQCEYDTEFGREFCFTFPQHDVIVSNGAPTNPNGDHKVRVGHYDNDSRLDIFVDSTVTPPYILRQLSDRTFQLITGLTNEQIASYSNWAMVSTILAYVSDLNVDGTDDLMLVGVSNYIPYAGDQLVLSRYNGSRYTPPVAVNAITADKQQFLFETLGLSQDPDYLVRTMVEQKSYYFNSHGFSYAYFNTAYLQIFQLASNGNVFVSLDDDPYNDNATPTNCAIFNCRFDSASGQWQMYVYTEIIETVFNYAIFNPRTVTLGREIDKVKVGTSTLANLLNIISAELGAISCDGLEADHIEIFDSVHNYEYFKTNTCSFAVLARYINAYSFREANADKRIQLRARKLRDVWWSPFYHASLSVDITEVPWHSALPELNALGQNKLRGWRKHGFDEPNITLLVAYINSTDHPLVAFDKITKAAVQYKNNLDYSIYAFPGTDYYNSNSYAKGLVDLVGTIAPGPVFSTFRMKDTVTVPLNNIRFPGLLNPVPRREFGN